MFGFHDRFLNEFFNGPSYSRRRPALPRAQNNGHNGSLIPNNFFSDSFFNEPMVFKENFYNVENDVKLNEEPDKYVVSFKDNEINKKELKVDFLKKENELRIQLGQRSDESSEEGNETHYSSSYSSSIRFDKPVKFDEIIADVNGPDVSIVIPKVESDEENVVNVQVKGNDSVKPLVDSKPQGQKTLEK